MRKFLFTLMSFLLTCSIALSTGSVDVSGPSNLGPSGTYTYTFTWTGDASDGSVPIYPMSSQSMDVLRGWHLYAVKTDPGTPAPSANYDIEILDGDDLDLMDGRLFDRSASSTESAKPNYVSSPVEEPLRLKITNQSVASATGVVTLFFVKEPVSIGFNIDDLFYCEMFAYNNVSNLGIVAKDTYVISDEGVAAGYLNGCTYSAGKLTVLNAGTYRVTAAVSMKGGANKEFHSTVGINGSQVTKCHTPRKMGTAGDVGSLSMTCLINVEADDEISIMIENVTDTTDVLVNDSNINLLYIGRSQ